MDTFAFEVNQSSTARRTIDEQRIHRQGDLDWMSWTHRGNDDRKFLTTSVVAEMKDLSKRSLVHVTFPTKK